MDEILYENLFLVIVPQDDGRLSGVPLLANDIIKGLLKKNQNILVLKPEQLRMTHLVECSFENVVEHKTISGRLFSLTWPRSIFTVSNRHFFVHALEKLILTKGITHLISFDIHHTGYPASIAANLACTPMISFITWADAFRHHLHSPHEIDCVARHSKFLFCSNPCVIRHIKSFNNVDIFYVPPNMPSLLTAENLEYEDEDGNKENNYILTSGIIDECIDLQELVIRSVDICLRNETSWIHAGIISEKVQSTFYHLLFTTGLFNNFRVLGELSKHRFQKYLQEANFYLCPCGGDDTGIVTSQAEFFNVKLSLPIGHWRNNKKQFACIDTQNLSGMIIDIER